MKKINLFCLFVLITMLSACGGSSGDPATGTVEREPIIYIAGYYENIDGDSIAAVWKDGVRTDLAGPIAEAYSVYVSNGHVYAAGYYHNGALDLDIAAVWKDGVKLYDLPIPSGTDVAYSTSIYVSDGHTYVAGYYRTTKYIAAVWEDGVRTDFPAAGNNDSFANSVYVSDGIVYVAGYYHNGANDIATIWKNGIKTDLAAAGHNSNAYSVYVSDGHVYVAGYDYIDSKFVVAIWKDGAAFSHIAGPVSGAYAYSIFVSK